MEVFNLLLGPVPQQYEDTSSPPNARTGKNSKAIYICTSDIIYIATTIWSTSQLYICGILLRGTWDCSIPDFAALL